MKKIAIFFALTCACVAQALDHCACFPNPKNAEQRKLKWSTTKWFSTGQYVTTSKPLPSKPGSGDSASVIWGGYSLEIDQNVNVKYLSVGADSDLSAKKRQINVSRDFNIAMAHGRGTNVNFENCTVQIASMKFNFYDKAQNAGHTNIEFTNSLLKAKQGFICIVPANDRFTNSEPKGITMRVNGKSALWFGGGVVMDEIFKISPKQWYFKWRFEERDGNIGTVYFDKQAVFNSCILEVKLSGNIKAGKYTLMELAHRKSEFKPVKTILNGKTYNLGDVVTVDGKSVKISVKPSPKGKDTKTANDVVLEVE